MKISFSVSLEPESGKQNFAIRLAHAMEKQGVTVTDRRPHVNLVFVKGVRPKCKNIFRLDGILMNTSVNYKKKNKSILNNINQCDGLIYQNEFCKESADHFIGKFKNYAIISNGASRPSVDPHQHRKPYLLTCCRWRPHKRLKATVDSFLDSDLHKDFDLVVLGDPDYSRKHPSVSYAGTQPIEKVWSYMLGCKFFVHLAYIDWCPNSVVEALVCGKNVLHSQTGGTKYVVRSNGICVPDKPWNFKPIELYNPPELDSSSLRKSYNDMLNLPNVDVGYLDINETAKQYINYCNRILDANHK